MSKRDTDILQIRKYLNGELDTKAMHRLEKRAQGDPFLMDAMQGYETAGGKQQVHLNELSGRLKQRIKQKETKILPLRLMGIAASVLIICSAGIWWFYQGNKSIKPQISRQVAQAVKPVVKTITVAPEEPAEKAGITDTGIKPQKQQADQLALNKTPAKFTVTHKAISGGVASVKATDTPATDTTPLNEMIVMEYAAQKKKDNSLKSITPGYKNAKIADTSSPVRLLQSRAKGVTITRNETNNSPAVLNGANVPANVSDMANRLIAKQMIRGAVIAKDNGQPLPGASVKIAGTNTGTYTDSNGRFTLNADTNKAKLVIASIGYQTRQVSANNRDSMKNIVLEPSGSDLSEVVVTGYISQPKDANETVISAHPQQGWGSFRKYLKANAISPDGNAGVVKLTFMVDRYGSITNIKVIKGISAATDQKAVSIMKDGPEWAGNSNRLPEKVHLRIRFVK